MKTLSTLVAEVTFSMFITGGSITPGPLSRHFAACAILQYRSMDPMVQKGSDRWTTGPLNLRLSGPLTVHWTR